MGRSKKRTATESDNEAPPVQSSEDELPVTKKAKTKSTKKEKVAVKPVEEDLEEEELEEVEDFDDDDGKGWTQADLLKLFSRMEVHIPERDKSKFESCAAKLDWNDIAFDNFSAADCKLKWAAVSLRLRRYRLLKELLDDAKEWVYKPWTNFYRSQKTNRHPKMPKRPLSTYMLFYMEKKDKVAKERPNIEMTQLSKIIAEMYKVLPEKQKKKYVDKAQVQREEYTRKMEQFYEEFPELKPTKTKRTKSAKEYPGPRKPSTPITHYLKDKMEKHSNEPESERQKLNDQYKLAWKELSDKKRIHWIKMALEDEERYKMELAQFKDANPGFADQLHKSVLNKEERALYEKSIGKPEKPPNSGYSLFSRIMLSSEEIKNINHKDRMTQISSMWKNLSPKDKRKYHDKVQQMLEQYKMDFATYLETLTPEQKEEALRKAGTRRKADVLSGKKKKIVDKPKKAAAHNSDDDDDDEDDPVRTSKSSSSYPVEEKVELFKGEPEAPPPSAFKLFQNEFLVSAKKIPEANRVKDSHAFWNQMTETDRSKWRKKLQDAKTKYISKYENFLKSLTQEQLKEYSIMKTNAKKIKAEAKSDGEEDEEDDHDNDEDDDSDSSKESSSSSSSSSSSDNSGSEDEDGSSSSDED
ncbi:nucleolar transcription factor 1-A-like [Cloeon dipterum]|uniref:nucleolar transcription factor 1-A-like n=1 Tax=Cloeon dipterum TaxID=197152 RepID=UPI00321FA1B0